MNNQVSQSNQNNQVSQSNQISQNNQVTQNNQVSQNNQMVDKINLLSDYVHHNLKAFQYLRNKNYISAKKTYKICISIATELKDTFKHVESLTNLAVSQYFCGKFLDSLDNLEKAHQISSQLYKCDNAELKSNIINSHIRVLCNLSLTSLALNKNHEARNYLMLAIEICKAEKDGYKLFKDIIYIFFRLDNLQEYYSQTSQIHFDTITINNENKDDQELHKQLISKTIFALHKFLRGRLMLIY